MSSYSKCQFCGNVDYTTFFEPRICGKCGISYEAGQEAAKERIIKLLEADGHLHNTAFEPVTVSKGELPKFVEMCVPFCPGCEAIALIKGEQK